MKDTNNEHSIRNAKIVELRENGYTLGEISKVYGLSVSSIYRICFNATDKDMLAIKVEREKRNNDIYKLFCEGHTAEYVGTLYGLTESGARQIYYKITAKQSELCNYFKSVSLIEKDAKCLTRVLNKIGVTTVKDFNDQDFHSLLVATAGASQHGRELFIKVKNPESFRLYEFIKQNNEKRYIKHRLYFILVDSGVETLDDFRTFNLNSLYFLKGKGDVTIGTLKELQKKVKALNLS